MMQALIAAALIVTNWLPLPVPNGDFEAGAVSWTVAGDAGAAPHQMLMDTKRFIGGAQSAWVSGGTWMSDAFFVDEGDGAAFLWATDKNVMFGVLLYTADGTMLANQMSVPDAQDWRGEWTRWHSTTYVPANAAYGRFWFNTCGNVDNVKFIQDGAAN